MEEKRTVIFIGETGAGKSTCANALAGAELFETSDATFSTTKCVEAKEVKLCWEATEYTVKIVDTIGLGDTDLSYEEVLSRLAEACHECREGINAVFFVIGKKFTKAQADAFDVLWQVLFGPEIVDYTTVVRSHFRRFCNSKVVLEDKRKLQQQKGSPHRILSQTGDRLIYVDCDDEKPEAMKKSGRLMLQYLALHCSAIFKPPIMEEVKKNISHHVEEIRRLERKIKELEEHQREMEHKFERMRLESENALLKEMQRLYEKMAAEARESGRAEGRVAGRAERRCLVS